MDHADRSIRALVAIIEGFDRLEIERTFPDHPSFQLVGVTHTLEETMRSLREVDLDVLLIASALFGVLLITRKPLREAVGMLARRAAS